MSIKLAAGNPWFGMGAAGQVSCTASQEVGSGRKLYRMNAQVPFPLLKGCNGSVFSCTIKRKQGSGSCFRSFFGCIK